MTNVPTTPSDILHKSMFALKISLSNNVLELFLTTLITTRALYLILLNDNQINYENSKNNNIPLLGERHKHKQTSC